jgi:hypothetical protein
MKFLRYFAVLILLAGTAESANAYRINVLDPPPIPTQYTTYDVDYQPFNATFTQCATNQIPGQFNPNSGQLCFSAFSGFTQTLTSLQLILPSDPNNAAALPICATDIFAVANCQLVGNQYILNFTGADINHSGQIKQGDYFTIVLEADGRDLPLDPAQFTNVRLYTPSIVPEPSSMMLLSTGIVSMGIGAVRRRWRAGR